MESIQNFFRILSTIFGFALLLFPIFGIIYSSNSDTSDTDEWHRVAPYNQNIRHQQRQNQQMKEVQAQHETMYNNLLKELPTNRQVTTRSQRSFSPDDAYDEGYDNGYEQGMEDGRNGNSYGYGYDDSSSYYDYYETKYDEGYEDGYGNGYYQGKDEYDEENDD